MYRILALFLFFSWANQSQTVAQSNNKHTVSGYVKDSLTGETLLGASILINGENRGISTNQYGFFSITLPSAGYKLYVSYVGYEGKEFQIDLRENQSINCQLLPSGKIQTGVVVVGKKKDNIVKTAQMGKVDLSIEKIKSIPAFMGEVDVLKALQLMPGIRNAGEGNSGLYVRGGGPDQNLMILDDAIVYNPGHLFGFFSVFNADAIKNTSLYKGNMPAQYGGRLSSVVDISMKDGNNKDFQVDGGIGLISSRVSIQGPLQKDKASFILSARRTYVDAIATPFIPKTSAFSGSGYFFYDLNAKMNYQFSDKDRIYVSGYFGRDVFNFNNSVRNFSTNIPWGNSTATLRWNHVFNKRLFANTTLVYNDYKFAFGASQNDFNIRLNSGIRDVSAKVDFDYYPLPQHKVKFGAASTKHRFIPSIVSGNQGETVFEPNNAQKKEAWEHAFYIQDDWEISNKLQVNAGLRFSSFNQIGPYSFYERDADGNKLDSTIYGRGETVKTYSGPEPRLTLRYSLNENSSIKAALTRNLQYIHLVSNAGSTLPTDVWVPSTLRVQPQKSWQYALGYFTNLANNTFEFSIEAYYKSMQNQIEYRQGYTPSFKDPEEEFVFGKGWSYGAEFFLNKQKGRLTGWIGYTLSWTWRQFPDLNEGIKFPARYDRRHDMSVVANYALNDKWKLGSVFVYGTGNAISLPERFYLVEGVLTQEYSRINAYRMPAYHRLDFSATYTPKPYSTKKYKSSWVFSIYNVYSRQNPYFIYFDQTGSALSGNLQVQALQVSLFPILPTATWNFSF